MDILNKINTDRLGDVVKEVEKSVDVKKIAGAATEGGKLNIGGAVEAIKKEITADEAKNIADKAKDLIK